MCISIIRLKPRFFSIKKNTIYIYELSSIFCIKYKNARKQCERRQKYILVATPKLTCQQICGNFSSLLLDSYVSPFILPFTFSALSLLTWNERPTRVYALRKRVGEGCSDRFRRYNASVLSNSLAYILCAYTLDVSTIILHRCEIENNKSFELNIFHGTKKCTSFIIPKVDMFRSRSDCDGKYR